MAMPESAATEAAVPLHVPRHSRPIPLDKGLPFIGNLLEMRRDVLAMLEGREKRYGQIWQTKFGSSRLITLLGPDALELVLKNRDGAFSNAEGWAFYINHVFPGAIMGMDGDMHRYQRRIMQVAFRKSALRAYIDQMAPSISHGIEQWVPAGQQTSVERFFPLVKQLTLDLAASVFMGVELGKTSQVLNRAFVDTVAASLAMIRLPIPGLKMWHGLRGREVLVERFRALLPAKRATHTSDFFSEFCHARSEDGEEFTDQEIVDHMIFLMMAAHDTTTSTLTSMMYLLARHPEWQKRLRDEAQALGKHALEYDDLEKLETLTWVIREALRLYPPLAAMPRMCVKETEFQGYVIPAKTMVGIYPIHVHHMPSLWTNPRAFDPERFGPGRQEDKRHGFAWVPFGGGAHMCIGQHFAMLQVKSIMHQLLLTYRWSVPENYEMPLTRVPITKPSDGLPLTFEKL